MKAVFGASFADGWLYEMRLGLDGVMTGEGMYADLMGRIPGMRTNIVGTTRRAMHSARFCSCATSRRRFLAPAST